MAVSGVYPMEAMDYSAPSLRFGPRPRSARLFGSGLGNGPRKTTRDGQQPKRRGPKPDSKPALTRRQELNRQAQRTHRERKEKYMRNLEIEVSRLREAYTTEIIDATTSVHQHKEMLHWMQVENDILKDILIASGIQYEAELQRRRAEHPFQPSPIHVAPINIAPSSTASQTAPLANSASNHNTTPATTISSGMSPRANGMDHSEIPPMIGYASQPQVYHNAEHSMNMDHSCGPIDIMQPMPATMGGIFESDPQLQVDFILTLESPCREHTDYLCRRSITEADDEDMPFSGHALMASCPPPSYIAKTTHEQPYPHKAPDLPHANLSTLLNLSRQLVTDGQITPIMALQCLKNHELYTTLRRDDIKIIMDTLNTKVRCYGFGAVVEDFELIDCLSSVLGTKVELGMSGTADESMYG
ncbi:bZIP transcription factor, bZIP-1 [Penicillium griseofulvum]|uniref:BZIP transcription factor, bZIP-1 n=1 Tax=Penicillium patulum TaxID=5078 RepID=A0A135LT01_PENPA|nr:bZIP transcription factor, bZIP-1 [Penicillium griseofulvum]KXG52059.1 bZIP transcription factor, bZIP-1 [Penicillium griseofulvum]